MKKSNFFKASLLACTVLTLASFLASCSNDVQDVNVVKSAQQNSYYYSVSGSVTQTEESYTRTSTSDSWARSSGTKYVVTPSSSTWGSGYWYTDLSTNTNYKDYSFTLGDGATYTMATATGTGAYGTPSDSSSFNSSVSISVTKIGGNYYVSNAGQTPTKLSVTDFNPESDTVTINWTETYDNGSSTSTSKTVKTITYNLTFKKVTE